MKFPLRAPAVLAAVFLSFGTLLSAQAQKLPQSLSSFVVQPEAALDGDPPPALPEQSIGIPGPMRSFLRMAGISQEVTAPEVLPMLSRNVFLHGYENGRETEYLLLVQRYLRQARELQDLAGADSVIRVKSCTDSYPLIHVLGYKFERGCSRRDAYLITQDAERAFLTVDSGFPLTDLEQDLQKGTPFVYAYPATQVPVLFSERDWAAVAKQRTPGNSVDLLLHDLAVDRLYSALARLDPQTRQALLRSPGLKKLLPLAPVLDFYGGQLCIRGGAVEVPGGAAAERSWQELVGASPSSPGEFVTRLLFKDRGWLAAYFDALSRVSPEQQAHFAQEPRLKGLYVAYRTGSLRVGAAAGVFPRNAELLLLFSRIEWQADGEPQIPGDLKVWQEVFEQQERSYETRQWARRIHSIDSPEWLLEALAASSNVVTETGLAQIYLSLSAMNGERPVGKGLSEETARLLAAKFADFNSWYLIFSDFPALDDASITDFVHAAEKVNDISNPILRANALGSFQADVGLWQIFARQGQIPSAQLNASWQSAIQPFSGISSSSELFDAARHSLQSFLLAVSGKSSLSQEQIIDLLAGPAQNAPDSQNVHNEIARRIQAVLDDQRLASLDTLFGLYDGLTAMTHGAAVGSTLIPLAQSLHEFDMPRPIFTGGERVAWSPLIYTNRHAELQVRTDLTKVLRSKASPAQLDVARGRLTPFLRDTLVGLNYAYYEPPGAQVLHDNPLFVRSHDFSVATVQGVEHVWDAPELVGIGVTAGGGAYLMGSLAGLPYALAETEEDFIAPQKVQALIWRETVPQLLVDATLPRWWRVTPNELHAVALYQRTGEELLMASTTNPQLRSKVVAILAERLPLGRLEVIRQALAQPETASGLLPQMLPSDTFYLAAQFRRRFAEQAAQWGPASQALDDLSRTDPSGTNSERLSSDFGVPHPTLADSDDCSLLENEPFPVSGGYTSRLFGESWESNNLYWARLADQMGYPPVMLNILIPELTRRMIANIFATNIDDWPALLRAMEETGKEFQQGKIAVPATMLAGDGAMGGERASK